MDIRSQFRSVEMSEGRHCLDRGRQEPGNFTIHPLNTIAYCKVHLFPIFYYRTRWSMNDDLWSWLCIARYQTDLGVSFNRWLSVVYKQRLPTPTPNYQIEKYRCWTTYVRLIVGATGNRDSKEIFHRPGNCC